jgi:hypothetical protein
VAVKLLLRGLVLDDDVHAAILWTPLGNVVRRDWVILTKSHCGQLVRIDTLRLQVADHRDRAGRERSQVVRLCTTLRTNRS